MKRIYTTIFTVLACMPLLFSQGKNTANAIFFWEKLEQATASVKSIQSDFKQVKHLSIFDDDIISTGKFDYLQANKISLNYIHPLPYLIVINGDKMKIVSDGKTNIMQSKDNKMMQEMGGMLTAAMTGDFSSLSGDYIMDYFDDSLNYLIVIKPNNETIKAYIVQIEIYLNKTDYSVDKLRITEPSDDYTDYIFTNKKFNALTDESIFKIN